MESIYERAVITMVAARGTDAGYHLLGLEPFKSGTRLVPSYMNLVPEVQLRVVSEVDALVEGHT